jgi:hypothetical protein
MKPTIPQGTRDFSSDTVRKRNYIFQTLRNIFEVYGFEPPGNAGHGKPGNPEWVNMATKGKNSFSVFSIMVSTIRQNRFRLNRILMRS